MCIFKGYTERGIDEVKKILDKRLELSSLSKVDIASSIGTTSQTIDNAFLIKKTDKEPNGKTFKSSDRVLYQVARALGVSLVVVVDGKKRYYIKK